ncbi:hypothetical protein KSP39_PZI005029 [Platanthera zijinensis]|uniref:Calmodulin-binding domain-containing protein n=1 Tax=Platanthera zijinensis TaxID=2320716 RepID=A0AAP0BTT7_9ASPA
MEKKSIGKGIISVTPTEYKAKEWPEKNSQGPKFLSNAFGKVRSRYLGVPTGSCHNFCKYGHKHESEEERKHVIFQRIMANSIDFNDAQNHAGGLNLSDGMKSSGFKLKPSDRSGNPPAIEAKAPSLKNNVKIPRRTTLQLSQNAQVNSIEVLNSSKKKKNQVTRQNDSPLLDPSPVKKNILRQNSSPACAEITCGRPCIFKEKVASYMKKTVTPSSLKSNSQKKPTASLRFPSEKKSVSLPCLKIESNAKTVISLKERIPRTLDRNVSKSFKMPLDMQNASIYSTAPAHSVRNLKTNRFGNVEHTTKEKDTESDYIPDINETIQVKSEDKDMDANNGNFSNKDDGYTSESFSSDVTELSEIEDMKRRQNHKKHSDDGKELRIRRSQGVQLDEDSPMSYKMNFKRGKVLELAPTETVGPKRLRFRRGRVIHESSKCEGVKRVIRRRNIGDVKSLGAEARTKSISIKLKHQDSQEKKDGPALFNHVIEETASKLAEVRKSKVKALVGAFETVISLQGTKARLLV